MGQLADLSKPRSAIVVGVTVEPEGEEEDVGYYADFDRYVIGERNEDVRRKVQMLRLEKRLCEKGEPRPDAGLVTLVLKDTLPLLRGAGLAG